LSTLSYRPYVKHRGNKAIQTVTRHDRIRQAADRTEISTKIELFYLHVTELFTEHAGSSSKRLILTLNIPSLARQRCLPSWGPRRTPWLFCNFSTVWCGRLLKLCFGGFWNYNSVIQALLVSNILCLFISTEVTGGTELLHTHHSSSIWIMSSSEHCRRAIFQNYNVQNLKITRITTFRIRNVVYQAGSHRDPKCVFNFLRFLKEHFISLIT